MRATCRSRLVALLCAALGCAASASLAQNNQGGEFSGRFSLGVRAVDVDGSEAKYREDVDLDDGPRLMDLGFTYAPQDPDSKIDLAELDVSGLGGEPFENVRFNLRKYGVFNLNLNHRRSRYFYEDTLTPPDLASVTASTAGDLHHFDFERVRDSAELAIDVSPATRINVDMEHFTRRGDSTTTLDLQRDEFELDKPIDESLGTVGFGIEHKWDRLTLIAEERVGDFESAGELFLPGFSPGENTTDTAELLFHRFNQPTEYDSRTHTLRLLFRPTARLDVNALWQRSDLDLDVNATESSAGTDFAGNPFSTALTGFAAVERDSDLQGLDLNYRINERVQLTLDTKSYGLDQAGQSLLGGDTGATQWRIDTDNIAVGVAVAVGPSMIVTAGWSTESRDVELLHDVADPSSLDLERTDRDGFFAELNFNPSGPLSVTASVENNSIDDPYTLSAPTDARRYRISGRYRWESGFAISGSLRKYDLDNDLAGWRGDTEQSDLRLNYQNEALQWSVGHGTVKYSRDIEQLVTGGTRQDLFAIAYSADTDFVDGSVRWQASPMVALGAYVGAYDNGGSFALNRDDWRGTVDIALDAGYIVQVAYRNIDYTEDTFDDFDAEIVTVAIGFRW